MPYNLTTNGIKLCRACCIEKPLAEFPIKRRPDGSPSYGRCRLCTLKYDHERRRKKGMPVAVRVEIKPKATSIKRDNTKAMRIYYMVNRPLDVRPVHNKVCKECNAPFKGYKRSVFCNAKCYGRYYRRITRSRERARLREVRTECVNPVLVFERYKWMCAYCGCDTPRHLKGKHKPNSPELDHIIPLSKGGEHSYTNTQLLCRKCNAHKADKMTTELCLVT